MKKRKLLIITSLFIGIAFITTSAFSAFILKGGQDGSLDIDISGIEVKDYSQKIISYIVKPITFVFYTAIVFFFGALWSPSIFITLFIILILNSYVSLFQAYVIYNDRHIKFREIVTLKNALFFFLSDVIIFAIVVLLVILFYLLFNVLYALILAIPFFIYTTNILSVGTEAYVYSKTRHKVELKKKQA